MSIWVSLALLLAAGGSLSKIAGLQKELGLPGETVSWRSLG